MNDLISRQAIIDALNKKWVEKDFKDEFGYGFDACLNWMDVLIRNLPSANQWIPCSERLPAQTGEYLVTPLVGGVRWTDKFGYTPTKDGGWYDPEKPNQNLINWNESIIAWKGENKE